MGDDVMTLYSMCVNIYNTLYLFDYSMIYSYISYMTCDIVRYEYDTYVVL